MTLAAVVLCAGKGTRMKSLRAKVLHPILGRPLCAWPIARALEAGADPVVAVVGHQADQVKDALTHAFPNAPLRFAIQAEQKGTGHAVQCAKASLEGHQGSVLITYGDVPLIRAETLAALRAEFERSGGVLALVATQLSDPTGYGRIVRDAQGRVLRVVEQKDASAEEKAIRECNAGIYLAEAKFLFGALATLTPNNAQGELYLTDLVEKAAKAHPGKVGVILSDAEESAGVNDRAELAARAKVLQARINLHHLREGVSMVDPASTFIDATVELGQDVELGPNVSLRGATRIARGVKVGQGSVVTDSEIGEGTEVFPYSVFEDAKVGKDCRIGPFARLRPATELSDGVHLGNFVETKKTRIGPKSKANHLSYLGDAVIGAGVNVGAGTITCNYDGVNKHTTVLEDGVFIGSDTQLVAPVTVRQGAYVAAGTTVTQEVPPESLAITRPPMTIKEGWVKKKREQKKTK